MSKNKARSLQVTMQILTVRQRVRKVGVWILCQVLLFDIRLPVATAAAESPRFLGPQAWMGHGICLTCGLCCQGNKAQHSHTHAWVAHADSSSKYPPPTRPLCFFFSFYSLKSDFVVLFGTYIHIHTDMFCFAFI